MNDSQIGTCAVMTPQFRIGYTRPILAEEKFPICFLNGKPRIFSNKINEDDNFDYVLFENTFIVYGSSQLYLWDIQTGKYKWEG